MNKQTKSHWQTIIFAVVALSFTSCGTIEKLTKDRPAETRNLNNSNSKPIRELSNSQKELSKEIVAVAPFVMGRFTQVSGYKISDAASVSPFEKGSFSERYLFTYNYADGRFDKYRDKDNFPSDVTVKGYKFETPEKAVNYLKRELFEGSFGKAIPEETYPKMRMCSEAESEGGTTDVRPYVITKTFTNPRGGNLQAMARGFHMAKKCQLDSRNPGGYAIWTDGVYAFVAESSGYTRMNHKTGESGQGLDNVTDFASDYVAAVKPN